MSFIKKYVVKPGEGMDLAGFDPSKTWGIEDKAQASEASAQKAKAEAEAAKRELEKILEKQRQELEKLKARKKDIIDTKL